MYSFLSDGAEYLQPGINRLGNTTVGDVGQYLVGNRPGAMQRHAVVDARNLAKFIPGVSGKTAAKVGRFAGRAMPLLSALGNVTDVADIVAGGDSFGNKAMDATAMGLGGAAGFFLGGPLGASVGASAAKLLSDGTQRLFGGGVKPPEQQKLEQALQVLNSRSML